MAGKYFKLVDSSHHSSYCSPSLCAYFWRSELHYKGITNLFGSRGFQIFKIGFAILFLSRAIAIILLAISGKMTMDINPILTYILMGIFLLPSIYLFYSVRKYFGIDRAFGNDKYGFLILWIPGILLHSKAAILAALFNHIYIWVHFYFTELPDIGVIYGDDKK